MKQIHELNERSAALGLGDVLAVDNGNDTEKIDYTKLAKAIIEQYNLSSLGGSNRTLKAILDALQDSVDDDLVPKTDIVNNVTTSTTGKVLDASQGKALQDQVTALNSSYNALSNYSGYPKVRYYNASNLINCNKLPTGWALAAATGGNYPTSSGLYWVNSLAYAVNNDGSVNTGIQIAYVYDSNAEARYFRKATSNTWSAWQLQPRKADIDELNSNLAVKIGSFTQASGQSISNNLLVRQSGHVVTVYGYLSDVSIPTTGATAIGTISGVSLPANVLRTICNVGVNPWSLNTVSYLAVLTNGEIQVTTANTGTGKSIYFNATWVV